MTSLDVWDRLSEQWTPTSTLPLVLVSRDDEVGQAFLVALPRRLRRALSRLSDRTEMYEEHIIAEIIAGALERAEVQS